MPTTLTEALSRAFGQVAFANNTNIKISGTENSGSVQNNQNLVLSSSESNINLKNNRNVELKIKNTTLDSVNSSNIDVNSEGGILKLNGDTNLDILTKGKQSRVQASGNVNADLKVEGTEVILEHNTNADVKTKNGYVFAKDNLNLNIFGEDNWISVQNTKDHAIQRSNTQDNKLLFSFKPNKGSSISSWVTTPIFNFLSSTSGETYSVRRDIEYVDKAEINGENYSTGIFSYVISQKSDTDFEIKVEGEKFESLTTNCIAPSQVILSGVRNNKKENFRIEAPVVSQANGSRERPVFHVKMKKFPSAI